MKLRLIALASASLIALVTPAAAGDGWYLGLGAGWSKMDELKYQRAIPGGKFKFDNAARFDAAAGFKWASGLRLELEDGYASYKVSSATTPAGALIARATGHISVGTLMPVVAYDIPITPQFAFTVGAGAGAGRVLAAYSDPTETNRKGKTAFAYQHTLAFCFFKDFQDRLRIGLFCFRVFHKLDRLHDPHAANVTDERVFLLQFEELVMEIIADDAAVCAKIIFFDHLYDGKADGHRDLRIQWERLRTSGRLCFRLRSGEGIRDGKVAECPSRRDRPESCGPRGAVS